MSVLTENQREVYVAELLEYGKYNDVAITEVGARALVSEWEISAQKMFDAMGGKLKWSRVTSVAVNDEDIMSSCRRFFTSMCEDEEFKPFMWGEFHSKNRRAYQFLYNLTQYEAYRDCLTGGVISKTLVNAHEYLREAGVTEGMKVSKAFLKLIDHDMKNYNPGWDGNTYYNASEFQDFIRRERTELRDKFSQKFSRLIQDIKNMDRKDTVYLSNDLMDWVKMSDFATTSSCHTWKDGGGMYCMGTLSYALQPDMLIAYTLNENGQKTWREVVYTDLASGHAIGSRQYPGVNDSCATTARNMWQEICMGDMSMFKFKHRLSPGYSYFSDYLRTDSCDNDKEFGYVDLLQGAGSDSAWHTWVTDSARPQLNVNHDYIICLECGERMYERESYQLTCDDCRTPKQQCEHCGEYHPEPDTRWVSSVDGYVCDTCITNDFTYCRVCHNYHETDNMVWIEREDRHVCESCRDRHYSWCDNCHEYHDHDDNYYVQGVNGSCDMDVCPECFEDMKNDNYIITCAYCEENYYDSAQFTSDYCSEECELNAQEYDETEVETPQPQPQPQHSDIQVGMKARIIERGVFGRRIQIGSICTVTHKDVAYSGRVDLVLDALTIYGDIDSQWVSGDDITRCLDFNY